MGVLYERCRCRSCVYRGVGWIKRASRRCAGHVDWVVGAVVDVIDAVAASRRCAARYATHPGRGHRALETNNPGRAAGASDAIDGGDREHVVMFGDQRYGVRGLEKSVLRSAEDRLLTSRAAIDGLGVSFHVDALNLYEARHRAAFVKQASAEPGVSEEARSSVTSRPCSMMATSALPSTTSFCALLYFGRPENPAAVRSASGSRSLPASMTRRVWRKSLRR